MIETVDLCYAPGFKGVNRPRRRLARLISKSMFRLIGDDIFHGALTRPIVLGAADAWLLPIIAGR